MKLDKDDKRIIAAAAVTSVVAVAGFAWVGWNILKQVKAQEAWVAQQRQQAQLNGYIRVGKGV